MPEELELLSPEEFNNNKVQYDCKKIDPECNRRQNPQVQNALIPLKIPIVTLSEITNPKAQIIFLRCLTMQQFIIKLQGKVLQSADIKPSQHNYSRMYIFLAIIQNQLKNHGELTDVIGKHQLFERFFKYFPFSHEVLVSKKNARYYKLFYRLYD